MQYQVPQFIETEDKIVGPLSLRQFAYVGAGAGLAALFYFILQTWVWIFFAVLLVGGAVAIAFIKIEGRPLTRVALSAFNFYWKPQTYVWQPEHPAPAPAPKISSPLHVDRVAFIQKIAEGMALHKSLEKVQTGEKLSDKQFIEKKMSARYQIYEKPAGDRQAARRVDYR